MTVAELFQWAIVRKWGKQRKEQMERELKKYIIFSYDINTCRLWREIRAKCSRIGCPISPQDAWIAAVARQYNLPLVTHNPEDFSHVDELEVITRISKHNREKE